MKRSFILVLALVAGLAGLAIGLAASRTEQPRAVKAMAPSTSSASYVLAASKAEPAATSPQSHVVRFASHPQPMPAFLVTDLDGNPVSTAAWKGKVVFINFWATWCPPCRKEIPDLETLYNRFKSQGLVILAISDEDASKVKPFIAERSVTYPVLLDPGRKVNELFQVVGIPKTFIYDRGGKLAAESIDMRTQQQFLQMLAQAGLQ
jgi:peroxiredoxin